MKANKKKVRKYLKCVYEFSGRFDLANGKYLSIHITLKRIYNWEYIFQLNNEGGGKPHEKKTTTRKNENRQRNNRMKSKQISFEVTRA